MKLPYTAQQLFIAALLLEFKKLEKLKAEFFKKLSLLEKQHKNLRLALQAVGATCHYKGYEAKEKRPQFWGTIQAGTVITIGMKSGAIYGCAFLTEYPKPDSQLLKVIYDGNVTFISLNEVAAIIIVSNEIRVAPGKNGDDTIIDFKTTRKGKLTKTLRFKVGHFNEKAFIYK
jgi:predicted SnoaL-like aldol condensation-catalyzing enzyme